MSIPMRRASIARCSKTCCSMPSMAMRSMKSSRPRTSSVTTMRSAPTTRATTLHCRTDVRGIEDRCPENRRPDRVVPPIEAPPAPFGGLDFVDADEGKKLRPRLGSVRRLAIDLRRRRPDSRTPIEVMTFDHVLLRTPYRIGCNQREDENGNGHVVQFHPISPFTRRQRTRNEPYTTAFRRICPIVEPLVITLLRDCRSGRGATRPKLAPALPQLFLWISLAACDGKMISRRASVARLSARSASGRSRHREGRQSSR